MMSRWCEDVRCWSMNSVGWFVEAWLGNGGRSIRVWVRCGGWLIGGGGWCGGGYFDGVI